MFNDPPERVAAGLYSNGMITLTLPPNVVGEHDVFLEMMGEPFGGAPAPRRKLRWY